MGIARNARAACPRASAFRAELECAACCAQLMFDTQHEGLVKLVLGGGSTLLTAFFAWQSGWLGAGCSLLAMMAIAWLCYPWLARYHLKLSDRTRQRPITAQAAIHTPIQNGANP